METMPLLQLMVITASWNSGAFSQWFIGAGRAYQILTITLPHWHKSQQVPARNVARTSRGLPGVTHQHDLKGQKDSLAFSESSQWVCTGEGMLHESPCASPFRLSFPNQAPTLPQWLTLLLRTGYCCLAAASGGQRVGPGRQPRLTVKAETELPTIPAVGGKWSQSSTFFPLDCQLFSKVPPPHPPPEFWAPNKASGSLGECRTPRTLSTHSLEVHPRFLKKSTKG